jgi:hypothetical protein
MRAPSKVPISIFPIGLSGQDTGRNRRHLPKGTTFQNTSEPAHVGEADAGSPEMEEYRRRITVKAV